MKPVLKVQSVHLSFRGLTVLDNVSFDVAEGEIVGLIGPNGAGKTSLFNCLSGIYRPTKGNIFFSNKSFSGLKPHDIAWMGIGRTFQNLALFSQMSVLENVMCGGHVSSSNGLLRCLSTLSWIRDEENSLRSRALDIIARLNLDLVAKQKASGLSYGVLKRVELARAMMSRPSLLLLDEPAGGLSHTEIEELKDLMIRLRTGDRTTQILVEHNVSLVMAVCSRVIVLDAGRVIADGTPQSIQSNPEVIRAYLGYSDL